MKRSLFSLVTALGLAACQESSAPPQPVLTLSPASLGSTAGDAATVFTATASNGDGGVTWSLAGPGTLSSSAGARVRYTPPAAVAGAQTATLTATLGASGVSAAASIVVNPAGTSAPPAAPGSPAPPTDPVDPAPPASPVDPAPPTDPVDPVPPTDPTDPEPPPPGPDVTIVTSKGGPVPWAVRYEVEAVSLPGYADDAPVFFSFSCGNAAGQFPGGEAKNKRSDVFVCFHMDPGEEVTVEASGVDGNTLYETTLEADVEPSTGKAFQGKWRFGAPGAYEVATIDQGDPAHGKTTNPEITNPGGEFYSIYYDFAVNDAFPPGIVVQAWNYSDLVVPEPLPDGTQRYVEPGEPSPRWTMERLE